MLRKKIPVYCSQKCKRKVNETVIPDLAQMSLNFFFFLRFTELLGHSWHRAIFSICTVTMEMKCSSVREQQFETHLVIYISDLSKAKQKEGYRKY